MLLHQPAARFWHDQFGRYHPIFKDHKQSFLLDTETIKFFRDNSGNVITDLLDLWVIKLNNEEVVYSETDGHPQYNQTHFLINIKNRHYKLLSSSSYTKDGHCLAYEDSKPEFVEVSSSAIIEKLLAPIVKYVRENISFVFANTE